MAWDKVWLGTVDEDFVNAGNWQPISLRNASFAWTQVGSTAEYYVRTAGGADPAFGAQPGKVLIQGVEAEEGTLGALTAGQWAYGDPDTLGYDTLVVRLAGDADPDSLAIDAIQFQAPPNGADAVTLSGQATRGITASLDQSGLSAAAWRIEPGFRNQALGDAAEPLRINPSSLVIDGGGSQPWYVDVGAANIAIDIRSAPQASQQRLGLYLTGSNIAGIFARGGATGVAMLPGQTSTVGAIHVIGGQAAVWAGPGVTLTSARTLAGSCLVFCDATTLTCDGGQMETLGDAEVSGSVLVRGGTFLDRSAGTHAAVTLDGGTLDTTQLAGAKTYTAMKHNAGTFRENVDLLTITTRQEPDYSGSVSRSPLSG